jgi:hypothetical protein
MCERVLFEQGIAPEQPTTASPPRGTESLRTLRWRETDSNFRSLPGSVAHRAGGALVAPPRAGPEPNNKPCGFGWLSRIRIDEQAVRRIGFRRPEPRIEAEPRRAIGAENRVLLAHVDVDVWVIGTAETHRCS